jgi:hypothetical protein
VDEIHEKNDCHEEENTADMEDDLSNSLGDNLGDILCDDPSEPEPTTQSAIESMRKIMDEQREMLNHAIQQNILLCIQNAELMEANQEFHGESIRSEATQTKIFDMTHPDQY